MHPLHWFVAFTHLGGCYITSYHEIITIFQLMTIDQPATLVCSHHPLGQVIYIHVYKYVYIYKYIYNKGIKNGCQCIVEIRGTQETLSASDLHNARATILNPFYNMEYEIIKKIRQNMTWIEADILGINLTPNRYNALAQPLFTSAMTSQSHSTLWRHNSNTKNVAASAREWVRNRFEIYGSALEHTSISLCTRANT